MERSRGGWLTAFLIFMLVASAFTAVIYLFGSAAVKENLPSMPDWAPPVLALFAIAKSVFALAIWRWKKWGMYGFAVSGLATLIVNLVSGVPILSAFLELVAVVILFGLLRRGSPARGISTVWSQMD